MIGFICYLGIKLQLRIEYVAASEFNYTPLIIFVVVFPILIGMLVRLPKLITEILENKEWKFDGLKFTGIALPALFIIMVFILSHSSMGTTINFVLTGGSTFTIIAGIVLGYSLLDCLKE